MPFPPDAAKKIRERLHRGLLPRDGPVKMRTGHGDGRPCAGCDRPILPSQVKYEFFGVGDRTISFHLGCAGLWEAYRRRRGWSHPPSPPST